MMKRRWIHIITLFLLLTAGSIGVFILYDKPGISADHHTIVATVNGETISEKDIEDLYQQLDGDYSRVDVLNDLIDELVVVTYAPNAGIVITDEQVRSELNEYQQDLPDLYESGIQIYGEEDFFNGHKMQLIYNEVYESIVEKLLDQDQVDYADNFIKETQESIPEDKEILIEEYEEEFYEYVFDTWLKEQRKEANIKVLSNKEDYNEFKEKLCIVITNAAVRI